MNLSSFEWLAWENPVAFWWVFLTLVAILNGVIWFWTFSFIKKSFGQENFLVQPRLLVVTLSALYVFGCAFRSILPRADVQRITLFDTWWSSVFVGRTVATFAELAFVAQWAILLYTLSKVVNDSFVRKMAQIIFPTIVMAEIFSWYAVIRTHYIGNTIEESLWGVTYIVIGICLLKLRPYFVGALKNAVTISILGCVLYVFFMFTVDVPMYYQRWQQDIIENKSLLGFFEGLKDLNVRWVVTHSIAEWRQEIPWMSLYFSIAVWVSLALCYVPVSRPRLDKYLKS